MMNKGWDAISHNNSVSLKPRMRRNWTRGKKIRDAIRGMGKREKNQWHFFDKTEGKGREMRKIKVGERRIVFLSSI